MLNGIGVDLPTPDRLSASGKPSMLMIRMRPAFQHSRWPLPRRAPKVINGEDSIQIGMRLQHVLGHLETLSFVPPAARRATICRLIPDCLRCASISSRKPAFA